MSVSRRGAAVRELEGHVARFLHEVFHTLAHEDLMSLGKHAVRNPDSWLRQRIARLTTEHQVQAHQILAADPSLTVRQVADRIRHQPREAAPPQIPFDRSTAQAAIAAIRREHLAQDDGR